MPQKSPELPWKWPMFISNISCSCKISWPLFQRNCFFLTDGFSSQRCHLGGGKHRGMFGEAGALKEGQSQHLPVRGAAAHPPLSFLGKVTGNTELSFYKEMSCLPSRFPSELALANWPMDQCILGLVPVNRLLLEHSHTPCLHSVYGGFPSAKSGSSRGKEAFRPTKLELFILWLFYRWSQLTPDLENILHLPQQWFLPTRGKYRQRWWMPGVIKKEILHIYHCKKNWQHDHPKQTMSVLLKHSNIF